MHTQKKNGGQIASLLVLANKKQMSLHSSLRTENEDSAPLFFQTASLRLRHGVMRHVSDLAQCEPVLVFVWIPTYIDLPPK